MLLFENDTAYSPINNMHSFKYILNVCIKILCRCWLINLTNTKWCKNLKKCLKPWQMGTPLRVLSKSLSMNTNRTGFRWFQKSLRPCALDKRSLRIGRVNAKVILINIIEADICSLIFSFLALDPIVLPDTYRVLSGYEWFSKRTNIKGFKRHPQNSLFTYLT